VRRTSEGGGGPLDPPIVFALSLASKGVPVFPCKPDKSPHTGNGFKAASTDEAKIRKWWETWPDALIGVPTGEKSGINVLDIDVKTGTVEEVLARLPETLPETRVHATRSGGRHYLFSASTAVRSRQGVVPGVDTRGDGGYVIWWPAHGCKAEDHKLAPTPGWLGSDPPRPKAPVIPIGSLRPLWEPQKRLIAQDLVKMDADCGYEAWYRVGAAIYHESGGASDGLALWESWSAQGSKYKEGECAAKWSSFKTDRPDTATWRGAKATVEAEKPAPEAKSPSGIALLTDLIDRDFEEVPRVIEGAIALTPGAWILAGKPKDGKTWLAMNLACAIASGKAFVGSEPPGGKPGGVLYINVDDSNERRFVSRIKYANLDRDATSRIVHVSKVDTEVYKSAYDMTEALINAFQGVKLLVIDTLGMFRSSRRNDNVYQQEYEEVRALNELGHRYGVCILIVHHFKKGAVDPEYPYESISGTLGLQGGVDGMIVLMRKDLLHPTDPAQDEKLAACWYRGRDLDFEGDLGIRLHEGQWRVIGTSGEVLMGTLMRDVIRILKTEPDKWWSSKDVASQIEGAKWETVRKALQRGARKGIFRSRPGAVGGFKWVGQR